MERRRVSSNGKSRVRCFLLIEKARLMSHLIRYRVLVLRTIIGKRLEWFIEKRKGYWGCYILSAADGNDLIAQLLKSAEPTAIGKLGSVETQAIQSFIKHKGNMEKWDTGIKMHLYRNAGVFPKNNEVFYRFCLEFLESLKSLDLIALWYNHYESNIVRNYATNAKLAEFQALQPYYHNDPWSEYLENKRVLVIHPFSKSIERQFQHRGKIWQDERCLPNFQLDTIKVPLSDALVRSDFEDWFDALQYMKTEMSEKEFDVAIVGAGAYSIPIVAHAKKLGKFAIHLGGAAQILFGIKGGRWDSDEIGLRFYNNYWSRPLQEETPQNAAIVEDGCYW